MYEFFIKNGKRKGQNILYKLTKWARVHENYNSITHILYIKTNIAALGCKTHTSEALMTLNRIITVNINIYFRQMGLERRLHMWCGSDVFYYTVEFLWVRKTNKNFNNINYQWKLYDTNYLFVWSNYGPQCSLRPPKHTHLFVSLTLFALVFFFFVLHTCLRRQYNPTLRVQ